MSQQFRPGDFLIFQLESGFGLLRLLEIEETSENEKVWHLKAYSDLFMDVEFADAAIGGSLGVSIQHVALTNRAFESTQVARMGNRELEESELEDYRAWQQTAGREVSDRSIRLMLGLR
jgi:hypothetical protein